MERRLLAIHNRARAEVRAPALAWDPELARRSAPYAAVLARRGRLSHSARSDRPGQGENLWLGTRGAYSIEDDRVAMSPGHSCERPGDVLT